MPYRYGSGPYKNASRFALDLAFYPILVAAWLTGVGYRRIRHKGRRDLTPTAATVGTSWDGVRHLLVLNPRECDTIAERVYELRDFWILRQPGFYTLGHAAYMDCRDPVNRLRYFEGAPRLNELLIHYFQPLYQSVIESLEAALGEPCILADQQAMPGFHIWIGSAIPHRGFDVGSVHFDLQYLDNGLGEDRWPTSVDVLSLTLPVRLPRAGGGLNVWDVRYPEPAGREVWPFTRLEQVRYEIGALVLHTGHELHQIAPVKSVEDDDERICLQGHAIRQNRRWLLYW